MALTKRVQEVINADAPIIVDGKTPKDRVVQWAAIRAQHPDYNRKQIAEKMGISKEWLSDIIQTAVKEGWLKFQNPLSRIEHEIIPKVVENLSEFLTKNAREDAEGKQLRAKVTLETAKNTIYQEYRESKGLRDSPVTILALKIEAPDPDNIKAITGEIIGQARVLEGEFKDESLS